MGSAARVRATQLTNHSQHGVAETQGRWPSPPGPTGSHWLAFGLHFFCPGTMMTSCNEDE